MSSIHRSPFLAIALALVAIGCSGGTHAHSDGSTDGLGRDGFGRDGALDGYVLNGDGSVPDGVSPCFPSRSCASLGVNCGPIANGCGGVIDCDTCATGQVCGAGGMSSVCGTPPVACMPLTCAAQHANCGPMGDGCGGMIDCGTCATGQSCGGGGDGGAGDAGCSIA